MFDGTDSRLQYWPLYLSRGVSGVGSIFRIVVFPKIVTDLGITGIPLGFLSPVYTLTLTTAVVPLAWAGDRYDERLVLSRATARGLLSRIVGGSLTLSVLDDLESGVPLAERPHEWSLRERLFVRR